jgi:hypothetical protein
VLFHRRAPGASASFPSTPAGSPTCVLQCGARGQTAQVMRPAAARQGHGGGIGFCAALSHMYPRAGADLPATATAAAILSTHRCDACRISRQRVQRSELHSGARAPSQWGWDFAGALKLYARALVRGVRSRPTRAPQSHVSCIAGSDGRAAYWCAAPATLRGGLACSALHASSL